MTKKGTVWAKKGLFDPAMIPRATSLFKLVERQLFENDALIGAFLPTLVIAG
jgi:hypothetical protein